MQGIIESKFSKLELNDVDKNLPFWKIRFFEGNAIGQIGHAFLIRILNELGIDHNDQQYGEHTEYDLISNNKKIEIKTARNSTRNTCQFNGLNPNYNYDFVFLLGIKKEEIRYKLISKKKINYVHSERSWYVNCEVNGNSKLKKLVSMNPGNTVNNKLTLSWKELEVFENFQNEINDYLEINNETE